MQKKMKIPAEGCCFNEGRVGFNREGGIDLLSYSGRPILRHFLFGNLIIDLQGIEFEHEKYPVLMDHDVNKKIGFSGRPDINGGVRITGKNFKFVDTPTATEFQKLSREEFPFQASIRIEPVKIRHLEEGEMVEVNGHECQGPDFAIFTRSLYKESSVCVFGADPSTHSRSFSQGPEIELSFEESGGDMTTSLADRVKELILHDNPVNPDEKIDDKTFEDILKSCKLAGCPETELEEARSVRRILLNMKDFKAVEKLDSEMKTKKRFF